MKYGLVDSAKISSAEGGGGILNLIKKVSIMDKINVFYVDKVYCKNVDPR